MIFCLLECAAIVFGLVPVFVSILPGAQESVFPDVTSFRLILCVLHMCKTHCLCEWGYIGVIVKFTLYRSVPLVLVALLREYAYSADLPWLPKFSKKKKKKFFFFFFFFKDFFHLPKVCLLNY